MCCERVTWGQVYRLAWRLADLIRQSGFEPDLIVAVVTPHRARRSSNLTLVGAGEPLLRLEKRLTCTACGELTARAYVRW